MYKRTTAEEVAEFLQEDELRFYDEREELEDLMDDEEAEFYKGSDMFIMVNPGTPREIWAIPTEKGFDLKAFENWLAKQGNEFNVHMNVTGMEPNKFRYQEYYDVSNPIKSYFAGKDRDLADGATEDSLSFDPEALGSELAGEIRLLGPEDEKIARTFYQTETRGVMDLGQVYAFIVKDELGKILGFFDEKNKLVAYMTTMYGVYDSLIVDDFYVLSSRRGKGVAASLAKAMQAVAKAEDLSIYWPIAETAEAQKIAEDAGYEEVSQRISIQNL